MKSRAVAIAGTKGSPGCSFLAVALARLLAESQIATLLVDADVEGGGLAALLDLGSAEAMDDGSVDAIQVDRDLWFAEIGQVRQESFKGLDWMATARVRYRAIVLDFGHSAGPLQRQLSASADWLLWVVVPDRSGLQRADATLSSARLDAARVGLIFNRVRRGCLEGAEEALAGRHQLPVLGRLTEDRHIADRLIHGLPVHRVWSLRRPLRELAKTIHPDVGSAASPWQ